MGFKALHEEPCIYMRDATILMVYMDDIQVAAVTEADIRYRRRTNAIKRPIQGQSPWRARKVSWLCRLTRLRVCNH